MKFVALLATLLVTTVCHAIEDSELVIYRHGDSKFLTQYLNLERLYINSDYGLEYNVISAMNEETEDALASLKANPWLISLSQDRTVRCSSQVYVCKGKFVRQLGEMNSNSGSGYLANLAPGSSTIKVYSLHNCVLKPINSVSLLMEPDSTRKASYDRWCAQNP